MDVQHLLARTELLAALGDEALSELAQTARPTRLSRGAVLFSQGDVADELYVVREGRVSISQRASDGRSSTVALMEAEDLFGEMSLFDGGGRSAEARALEPTQLVAVPYLSIRPQLEAQPQALWKVVALLTARLRATDEALADSVFLDVTGRTAKHLLEMAGQGDEFVLPVTQEELAAMVGASRERVNKAIATFGRLGWIQQVDRHYRITNREQLALRAT